MLAVGDKLLPILSCDVIGVSCSMPVSRLGYSTSSGGKDIGVVTVVVVGLALGAVLGLQSLVLVPTLSACARSFNTL